MSDSFQLKVYTPTGLLVQDSVDSITLPTVDGEIGLLPHHVKYTGLLGVGSLQFTGLSSGQTQRLVISGGFCSFADGTFTILADSVDRLETVDRANYDKERAELSKFVQTGDSLNPDFQLAQEKLARIEAIDKLIGH